MRRRIHVRRRQWHWKVLNVLALANSQESVEEDTLHGSGGGYTTRQWHWKVLNVLAFAYLARILLLLLERQGGDLGQVRSFPSVRLLLVVPVLYMCSTPVSKETYTSVKRDLH
jgi:hypothetical protein